MGPIKPGDRFLLVQRLHRGDVRKTWVTVTKVGRRWAEYQPDGRTWRQTDDRFDMNSGHIDGAQFSSPGRAYRTEEEYETHERLKRLWADLRKTIDRAYTIPEGVTDLDILRAADALKIRLKEE